MEPERPTDPPKTEEPPPRRILHVDCDAFFVQVARLLDPEGVGREALVIVGGSASGRGVVTSASYAARAYGVRSAMPTAQALRLCPDAVVAPVSREAISERSRSVRSALERLAPVVQAASVDEFYLDLSGTERLFGFETLEQTAHRIRASVLEVTEISVSIGGASRKLVAKLATNVAKPGGVHVVPAGDEAEFMRRFDLADIPGVGPALAASLKERGLVTVEDALALEEVWLQRWLGQGRGSWLFARIRGRDASRINPREPRKSISSERTFFEDLDDRFDLERQLHTLSRSVARTLRQQGLRARTVTVKLRDRDFRTRSAARTLDRSVESDRVVFEVSRELLEGLRRARPVPARLLGVAVTNLEGGPTATQLGFFGHGEALENDRDRSVSRAVDTVRERFGDSAIVPAPVVRPNDR